MNFLIVLSLAFFSLTSFAQNSESRVSGCSEADYVFADVESSINFQGKSYTPKCLKVEVGSQVSIAASSKHPLAPQDQKLNPISNTEKTLTYEFNDVGVFGYFCTSHSDSNGNGMAGAIWVVDKL